MSVLALSFANPLVEAHGFRQAQTAIGIYWMLHGGGWVDYWTPVLGPPWSIPFEFPLYQWLVAAMAGTTGLPINGVGRVVSYGWLLASLPPALALARAARVPPATARIYAILLLASPLYLFWGRAVLIETQAVALSVWFLWWTERTTATGRVLPLLGAVLAGAAAALTKITTWGPFLVAAGVIVAWRLWRAGGWTSRARVAASGLAVALPGLVLFAAWNAHADRLKALNPLALALRSDAPAMVAWNFGTLGQRASGAFVIAQMRALVDLFGLAGPVLLVLAGWALVKARPSRAVLVTVGVLLVLYELPWLVLANLHTVHNYYQTANGLFAVAAVAVVLAAIAQGGAERRAAALCVALLVSQIAGFAAQYAPSLFTPNLRREWAVAQRLREGTQAGEAMIAYGLDWSPVVPYEVGLVARMEPQGTTPAAFRARLPGTAPAMLDGRRVAAVVRCPSDVDGDPVADARLAAIARAWRSVAADDCLVSFAPRGR